MARREQQQVEPEEDRDQRGLPDRVFQHPLRIQILAACRQREVTPREFAEERRLHVPNVGYHFRALYKAGYLEVARKEQARGASRHFYRAKQQRADREGNAPEAVRRESHLTWASVELDAQGWKDLMEELDRTHQRSNEIAAEARERLRESGEEPIQTIVGLGGFEKPPDPSS